MGRSIRLKTALPGPKSRAWLEKKERLLPKAISVHVPVIIEKAQGVVVTDVDGNSLLDFTGGLGVLNVGHANARVVRAVQQQAKRFLHTDFSNIPYAVLIELAERLVARVPGSGPKKAFFFNSGAEAIENAIKFARLYTGRPAVLAFEGAFHGRTLLALSLTGRTQPYKAGLGPFAPEVYRLPYPYVYRKPDGFSDEAYGEFCAEAIERALRTQVAPR
ncbi:MAG TPA: aminotransferase class III-fold pyridoxal phosphate-dependent enzyme, partial [Bacillota bacterium]